MRRVLCISGRTGQALPLVLDSPHSGSLCPGDFRSPLLPDLLRQGVEHHVDRLFLGVVADGAVLLRALFPRSYIDPNRGREDVCPADLDGVSPWPLSPSLRGRLGVGLVWTRLPDGRRPYPAPLPVSSLLHRVENYYLPYHRALRQLLDDSFARFGMVVHFSCHSMGGRPDLPDFVLGDRHGTSCSPALVRAVAGALRDHGCRVALNVPYAGMELVRAYADPQAGRHSLQIEIRRDLYMDEETGRARRAGFRRISLLLRDMARMLAPLMRKEGERPGRHQPVRDA